MGGELSALKNEIKEHAMIGINYHQYLEPVLTGMF